MRLDTKISVTVAMAAVIGLTCWLVSSAPEAPARSSSVIVQSENLETAVAAVRAAGGKIAHELGIIDAVAAELTPEGVAAIEASGQRVHDNRALETAAKGGWKATSSSTAGSGDEFGNPGQGHIPYTWVPSVIEADRLHSEGILGNGVTVAVLDSGINAWDQILVDGWFEDRLLAHYDAIENTELRRLRSFQGSDDSGHGTHVAAIAINSEFSSSTLQYNGVAPNAQIVAVRAFDGNGQGTYADVIRGLEWLVSNRDRFGIRIVNLSFSAPPQTHYWEDPVNQAVMRAWQAGIVVVASAGNVGPDPMTVGVPGNVPYVITVGAMTDSYTPTDPTDDRLASFSSAGPTAERFVKPEIVAPGGHVKSTMEDFDLIAIDHPEFHDRNMYFTMSGTSQAAAAVTGVAALVLDHDPTLTPDEVKCRIMAGSHPAVHADGSLAYSVFQQGVGLVNAYDAVHNLASECANRGLNVDRDLAGTEHYAGHAQRDDAGNYFIEGLADTVWNGSFLWDVSFLWNDSMLWNDSFLWNDGLTEPVSVNVWVEQQ